MKFLKVLVLVSTILVINSCKNDLDLNAPYKEIPSIYAVLNPQENEQMIRINKVFLGEQDANQMAKVADSINYAPGELSVTLRRYVSGKIAPAVNDNSNDTVITFGEAMVTTSPGSFNTNQRVYVTSKKLHTTGLYRLTVKNLKTGNVFTAQANALAPITPDVRPLSPIPVHPFNIAIHKDEWIDYSNTAVKFFDIKHRVNDAFVYELTISLNIDDYLTQSQTERWKANYVVGARNLRETVKLSGNTYVSHTFTGGGIFAYVAGECSKRKNPILGRKLESVEFIVHSSTQDYVDYMEYIKPSLSISQNKPLYSNFENAAALGLFTFRSTYRVTKSAYAPYVSSFAYNAATCSYKFYTFDNELPGCK